MALITERGNGSGSNLGNVTIRAWITVALGLCFCINSLAVVACQILNAVYDLNLPPIQPEPLLANVFVSVVTFYFTDNRNKNKNENTTQ